AVQEYHAWEQSADYDAADSRQQWLRSNIAWAAAFAATTPISVEAVNGKLATTVVQHQTGDVGIHVRDWARWNRLMRELNGRFRALIWDAVGNPFAAFGLHPDWRTPTAIAVAGQMYESRDFSAMPILADALQDAGCDDE